MRDVKGGETGRVKAIDRLRSLDPVFSLADMQAEFGMEGAVARLYAYRWVEAGFALRFGQGVFFNLFLDPNGPQTRRDQALDKLLRLPVLMVGGNALHAAGWTTQRHQITEIAVPVVRGKLTVPKLETWTGVVLTPRYVTWFDKLRKSVPEDQRDAPGVPVAAPEYALADIILSQNLAVSKRRRVYLVPPDEIDPDHFDEEAAERLLKALVDLGATEAEAEILAEPYTEIASPSSGFDSW